VVTPGVAEDDYHVVEKGDTWWSIAREHGIDLATLYARNGVSGPDTLPIGKPVNLAPLVSEKAPAPQPSGNTGWFARFIRWLTGG